MTCRTYHDVFTHTSVEALVKGQAAFPERTPGHLLSLAHRQAENPHPAFREILINLMVCVVPAYEVKNVPIAPEASGPP